MTCVIFIQLTNFINSVNGSCKLVEIMIHVLLAVQ